MHIVVYSKLEVVTVGVTVHHIFKKYQDDTNRYGV